MRSAVVLVTALVLAILLPAGPAQAHPLGNFSINQYAGLTLHPDSLDAVALADMAEIPTLQEKPTIDTDGDGTLSPTETATHAASECSNYANALTVTLGNDRLTWTVSSPSYEIKPGAGGLATSRLSCHLNAPAELTTTATLRVTNSYRSGRVGWRELTATGDNVRLNSPLPTTSISQELTSYPRDLLTSAPDVRSATIEVGRSGPAAGTPRLSTATPDWLASAQSRVESLVGGHLTPVVIVLAFALALLLGAAHAALPGHGKTVMAAYFAGKDGRIRDALSVGATVTLAHTGGVLIVGLLLTTSTALIGEQLLSTLSLVSGLLITAVGITMLATAVRSRRPEPNPAAHSHSHGGHSHSHGRAGRRLGLAGIGLAGGLVPSPSALVVLLGAIGLGRTTLGILLVLAYGIGMAGTLTAVGLVLVLARPRLAPLTARTSRFTRRLAATAPTATATLVVLVGLGVGLRAVT
jgi:ABC-type nickel/cobalt efflux system permease component RcnA